MNDIRRTILWVIFGFSLVMLWDQWQVYNGHRPTFLPSAKTVATDRANAPVTPAASTSGVPGALPRRPPRCRSKAPRAPSASA